MKRRVVRPKLDFQIRRHTLPPKSVPPAELPAQDAASPAFHPASTANICRSLKSKVSVSFSIIQYQHKQRQYLSIHLHCQKGTHSILLTVPVHQTKYQAPCSKSNRSPNGCIPLPALPNQDQRFWHSKRTWKGVEEVPLFGPDLVRTGACHVLAAASNVCILVDCMNCAESRTRDLKRVRFH